MKTLQGAIAVNSTGKRRSVSEGIALLHQLPRIRDGVRYRSDRFELLGSDHRWRVFHRSRVIWHLNHWENFGLVKRKAESVLLALKREGSGLASDDPNPVLLTNPEFKDDVRHRHMPNVRKFFRFRGRTFYELRGTKWVPIGPALVFMRISERILEECDYWIWPKSHEACIEELKLEGRNS